MTPLRQKMTDELVRRNYSEGTARLPAEREGICTILQPSARSTGPRTHPRIHRLLFEARQLSSSSVSQQVAALRFFYVKTFRKGRSVEDTPYPKRESGLPLILSVEEVSRLIAAADTPYHRTLESSYKSFDRCCSVHGTMGTVLLYRARSLSQHVGPATLCREQREVRQWTNRPAPQTIKRPFLWWTMTRLS